MAPSESTGCGPEVLLEPTRQMRLVREPHRPWQIAGAHALERPDVAHPLGLIQAAVFQAINPKAWIFALGAVTTFRPPELPVAVGSIAVAVTMMVVIVPSAAIWAAGGGVLGRFVTGGRAHRVVSLVLAALVALSVVYVWA